MQNKMSEYASLLLREGKVDLVIGYEAGSESGTTRPFIACSAEDAARLVFEPARCVHNLAVYLYKKELVSGKKVAVTATIPVAESICRLAVEHQLDSLSPLVLTCGEEGSVRQWESPYSELAEFVAAHTSPSSSTAEEQLARLEAMSREERWRFWTDALSPCVKCYACRAACPLCYCTRCIVEVNRPQWIEPWPVPLANVEWQINRVMHMAGRCTGCGACARACPLSLPINLLTLHLQRAVKKAFPDDGKGGNVLSTFRPNDEDTFIR